MIPVMRPLGFALATHFPRDCRIEAGQLAASGDCLGQLVDAGFKFSIPCAQCREVETGRAE